MFSVSVREANVINTLRMNAITSQRRHVISNPPQTHRQMQLYLGGRRATQVFEKAHVLLKCTLEDL